MVVVVVVWKQLFLVSVTRDTRTRVFSLKKGSEAWETAVEEQPCCSRRIAVDVLLLFLFLATRHNFVASFCVINDTTKPSLVSTLGKSVLI